jgi:hypothetical protein
MLNLAYTGFVGRAMIVCRSVLSIWRARSILGTDLRRTSVKLQKSLNADVELPGTLGGADL